MPPFFTCTVLLEQARAASWSAGWSFLACIVVLSACADAVGDENALRHVGAATEALELEAGGEGASGALTPGPSAPSAGRPDAGPAPQLEPIAQWTFDDCSDNSLTLADSASGALTATRTASVTCLQSQRGQAVVIDERNDRIDVPANPALALGAQLTVATWVNPQSTARGTLVTKQTGLSSVFELALQDGELTFTVRVRSGRSVRRVSVHTPIAAAATYYVVGVYDGQYAQLYVNGELREQIAAAGAVADMTAPVRIGNDARSRYFPGPIDEVTLWNRALSADEISARSCVQPAFEVAVTPASSGPVPLGTLVSYDVAVTNRDLFGCSTYYVAQVTAPYLSYEQPEGFSTAVAGSDTAFVYPGETVHFTLTVQTGSGADSGSYRLPFLIAYGNRTVTRDIEYVLAPQSGCFVSTRRELLMRDLSVIEDPLRTTFQTADDPRTGVWTFGWLMEQLAPSPAEAPAMVRQLFEHWLTPQTINGFTVAPKTFMSTLLSRWPKTADGQLDLHRAPLRLLAIVNRVDLRDVAQGHAGQGSFAFTLVDPFSGNPIAVKLLLEYRLAAANVEDVEAWAQAWHQLAALPFPSEAYNAALAELTMRFTRRGSGAFAHLRSDDPSSFPELREFALSPSTGLLVEVTVAQTPDASFQQENELLTRYVNANEAQILQERHVVPAVFEGVPFLAGVALNRGEVWNATGISNPEARWRFALNTCDGCHGAETQAFSGHLFTRVSGNRGEISGFMRGAVVADPITGEPRAFNDLERRVADMTALVCGGVATTVTVPLPGSPPLPAAPTPEERAAFLARGIGRVH